MKTFIENMPPLDWPLRQDCERTLDDSANRRISMPEGFLCADAILRLCRNVTDGLHVNEKVVERTCRESICPSSPRRT